MEEDQQDYLYSWARPYDYPILTKSSARQYWPWRYQDWEDTDTYPMMAEYTTYYGGGYVVELFPRHNNTATINNLKEKQWIDRNTRVVIVEFGLFNPATTYFDSVNIVFERPATGGIVTYAVVTTFKLYRYTSAYYILVIMSEVLFIVFTLLFTYREAKAIYKQRWPYFYSFWNLVEFANLVISVVAASLYLYRDVLAHKLLERIPRKQPDKFINLYFAAQLDLSLTYVIALICFTVTVKFIKLLRFNKRISMLSSTLKKAWFPLSMFGISFGVILIAFTMVSYLTFGNDLEGYKDLSSSFASIISLLLGKFRYYPFVDVDVVMGPAFFFGFNIFVNLVVMNMYISILNDSITEVRNEVALQLNEYEMVDYTIDKIKGELRKT